MSIIGWIILGLIAGWVASKIVGGTGQGFFLDLALGIVSVPLLAGSSTPGFLAAWAYQASISEASSSQLSDQS
jgi:uncharacterized membrane protein YeaQ/YmgE (transglycosylase-associated protein family)